MDKKTEALKLALALEVLKAAYVPADLDEQRERAITAIREALADQPAQQEPSLAAAWQQGYDQGVADERTSEANIGIAGFDAKVNPARNNPYSAKQPAQQEWPKPKFVRNVDGVPCITLVEHEYLMRSRTSPQQSKPWVGLTDEEIEDAWPFVWRKHESVRHFAIYHAIEAKLREKNA